MIFLESPATFAAAVLLFFLGFAWRSSRAARRLFADAREQRELAAEVRGAQIALGLYLFAWGWLWLQRGRADAQALHVAVVLVHTLAGIALLRVLDVAAFAALRALRGQSPSRIVRSVAVWLLTFGVAAAGARSAWQLDLGSLLTTSALLSVVLGFALQEPLGNLFAGLTLNAEHPFEPGDWISFDKFTGRVLDVGWRSTRLLSQEEDELLVPNGFISRAVVVNHSRPSGRRVTELQLTADIESSPAEVARVLRETARAAPGVLALPPPEAELLRFAEGGMVWRLRYSTPDFAGGDAIRDRLHQSLWYALRRAGLDLPHAQLSIYRRERPADAEARRREEHLAEAKELLGRIDFVAALKPEARAELARHARFLEFGPGEAVVRQGDAGDAFYLVARGELGVKVEGAATDSIGKEVARLRRGDFFGEMALLTGEKRTATVLALGEAALLAVDREPFERLFAADEGMIETLARAIAGRKSQLASAREELDRSAVGGETQTLLERIRGIFGAKG